MGSNLEGCIQLAVLVRYDSIPDLHANYFLATSMAQTPLSEKIRVQKFGGPWSLIKIDLVDQYLKFFNTALKNSPFDRVYIDAFAGSGAFRYADDSPFRHTLFGEPAPKAKIYDGSAIRALRIKLPFHTVRFIENDEQNVASLRQIIDESGHPDARVDVGDANKILSRLCQPQHWRQRRGVIFLDPFGMSVRWSTLKVIAETKALDVWYLFPLGATIRNLPRFASALDDGKREAVTRLLGTKTWFEEFYRAPSLPMRTLFGTEPPKPILRRTASVTAVEAYARQRLNTLFAHVEPPRRLVGRRNQPLFSLFFAMSNPSTAAIKLARKGAAHILHGS